MAGKYDATKASKIKRLNERQAEIRRQFGENSSIYRDYHNALLAAVGPENFTPSGNIKRGPATYEILDDDTLNTLLRKQTAGQIKEAARREAREETEITGELVTMEDVIQARETMDELYEGDYDDFYEAAKFYWNSVGGKGHPRPTYTQLDDIYQVQEAQRRGIDSNPFTGEMLEAEVDNIEDKLRKRIKAQTEKREANMIASYFE